jgi:hypothetical protein
MTASFFKSSSSKGFSRVEQGFLTGDSGCRRGGWGSAGVSLPVSPFVGATLASGALVKVSKDQLP